MADEELDQQVAPEEGTQETPEQQAEREEREGQLQEGDEQPEESSQEGDGEDAAAKRSKRVQKRIDQLTKQRHQALREAEELREENRKLKEQQTVQPPADDPRPSFDSYDSVEQFEKDIEAWSRRQAQREAQATQQEKQSGPSVEEQEAIDRIQNAAIEASDRYPDFEDVVYDPSLPLSTEMIRAAADTESVADVLYHLGKNPQEAQRLSQLNGTSLIREMGRLEARLEANNGSGADAASQGGEQPTSAPEPIQPVKGNRAKREPTNPDELDIDTWMERERERLAKQRR